MSTTSLPGVRRVAAVLLATGLAAAGAVALAPSAHADDAFRRVKVDSSGLGVTAAQLGRACGPGPVAGRDGWVFALVGPGRIVEVKLRLTNAQGKTVRAGGPGRIIRTAPPGLRVVGAEAKIRGSKKSTVKLVGGCPALARAPRPVPPKPAPPKPAPPKPAPRTPAPPPLPAPQLPAPPLPAPDSSPDTTQAIDPAVTPSADASAAAVPSPAPSASSSVTESPTATPSPDDASVQDIAAPIRGAGGGSQGSVDWSIVVWAAALLLLVAAAVAAVVVTRVRAAPAEG